MRRRVVFAKKVTAADRQSRLVPPRRISRPTGDPTDAEQRTPIGVACDRPLPWQGVRSIGRLDQPVDSHQEGETVNPPWAKLGQALAKLEAEGAAAIVIAPLWPSALWWATLQRLAVDSVEFHDPRHETTSLGPQAAPTLYYRVCVECRYTGGRRRRRRWVVL